MTYRLDDLIHLMACLRDPSHGCPWDREQTYKSIIPFTLEEAYEVADVIERGALDELCSELGDLLFQVVFYARLAEEDERFSLEEVIHSAVLKLLSRHPHVFHDATFESFGHSSRRPCSRSSKHGRRKRLRNGQIEANWTFSMIFPWISCVDTCTKDTETCNLYRI